MRGISCIVCPCMHGDEQRMFPYCQMCNHCCEVLVFHVDMCMFINCIIYTFHVYNNLFGLERTGHYQ